MSYTTSEIDEILSGLEIHDDGSVTANLNINIGEEPSQVVEDFTVRIEDDEPEDFNGVLSELSEFLGETNPNGTVSSESTISTEETIGSFPIQEEVQESTVRFSGATWYNEIKKSEIVLAGVGGIGSYVAFLLARMDPSRLFIYDPDKVEEVNMAGQLFVTSNIGQSKVEAVSQNIYRACNYSKVVACPEFFTLESTQRDIMICGFDNMVARKTFYTSWKQYVEDKPEELKKNCLFIDGRLAAEKFQVFALTGDDVENMKIYEDTWLFNDSEAAETLCSYKQTTYMANMIGSIMVNIYCNFMANLAGSPLPLDVPFKTTYDGGFMLFDTNY